MEKVEKAVPDYRAFVEEAKEYKERIKYQGKKKEDFKKVINDREVAKISGKKRQSSRNNIKQQLYKEIE